MIGKKNIVFGFLYLLLTASLGPVMIINHLPGEGTASGTKKTALSFLKQASEEIKNIKKDNYIDPDSFEKMKPKEIGYANTKAIIALSDLVTGYSRQRINDIKGGPHAHGNMEAILNILAGFLLCFVAVSTLFKQIISWVFISGALLHSGLLYLAVGLELDFAAGLLGGWFSYIGPALVLLGLLLAGIAALMGFKGQVVTD